VAASTKLRIEDLESPQGWITPAGAREALVAASVLLPRAYANHPISYKDLCDAIENRTRIRWIPVRVGNLLGTLGRLLVEWSQTKSSACPELQSFAVNGTSEVPGAGFYAFVEERFGLSAESIEEAPLSVRQYWTLVVQREAHTFSEWDRVIGFIKKRAGTSQSAWEVMLAQSKKKSRKVRSANNTVRSSFGGGPESAEHQNLKRLVRQYPELFGISKKLHADPIDSGEFWLPSCDEIDVLFHDKSRYDVVEVKPSGVSEFEHRKGLYQCVKYRSILDAMAQLSGERWEIRAKLVCGGPVSASILHDAERLKIKVYPNASKK
jgi:hypothetical protein